MASVADAPVTRSETRAFETVFTLDTGGAPD